MISQIYPSIKDLVIPCEFGYGNAGANVVGVWKQDIFLRQSEKYLLKMFSEFVLPERRRPQE